MDNVRTGTTAQRDAYFNPQTLNGYSTKSYILRCSGFKIICRLYSWRLNVNEVTCWEMSGNIDMGV